MMRSWRAWIGLLVSAGFLFYAFRGQDFSEIRQALREVNYAFVPLALAFYFVGVWIRAVRWSVLLRPVVEVRARQVFPVIVVGYMANNILPLRTGELVRAYVLRQRYGVRKTSSLATIAVERLFDGLTMLGFILAAMTVVSLTSELQHLAIVAFGLFAAVLIGLFALTLTGDLRDRLLQLVLGPMPAPVTTRVERMAESFLSGLGVLRRKMDLALVAGLSLLAWLCEASMYWVLAHGFGGEVSDKMGVAAALLTTGVANLATLIPSSPGYVGPFEYGVRLVLSGALGVPVSMALSYAILVHAALYFPITFLGIGEWWRLHLSLGKVRELAEDQNGSTAPVAPAGPDAQSANGRVAAAEARRGKRQEVLRR